MFFCTEFGLLPEREVEPLEVLVKPIRRQYMMNKNPSKWWDWYISVGFSIQHLQTKICV